MADGVDTSKLENALEEILEQTSTLNKKRFFTAKAYNEGIKKLVGNEGVGKLVDKLEAIRGIQAMSTGATSNNSLNGINLSTVNSEITKISAYGANISDNVKKIFDFLENGKNHSTTTATAQGTPETNDSISKSIDIIKDAVLEIRDNLAGGSGDKEYDELVSETRKLRAEDQNTKAKYDAAMKKDRKEWGDKEKEAVKKYQEEQKNREKNQKYLAKGGKTGVAAEIVGKITNVTGALLSSEKASFSKAIDKTTNALSSLGPGGAVAGGIISILKQIFESGVLRERAGTDYARQIGGGRLAKNNFAIGVNDTIRGVGFSDRAKGYRFEEIASAMTEAALAIGRSTEYLSKGSMLSAVDLKRFGIGAEAINNFDSFGKSIEETDKYFAKLYGEVSKKGLSFKNVSKAVNDNLRMAQSHTFANGLRGLEKMAEKSTQLKYNMQQVFNFADKVSTIEGAITTSANLSVLGGQYAQFADPMQLLYESLNDTEALNNRIINMYGNKAHWDAKKGEMTMGAEERRMLMEAAKAAGLDPNEMLNLSYNQSKMRHIEGQIHGVDKETAEYIKNIAEIRKDGRAYVNLNGEEKMVSKLSETDKIALEKASKAKDAKEGAKLGDVYQATTNIGEKLDNFFDWFKEKIGSAIFGIFKFFMKREDKAEFNRIERLNKLGGDEETRMMRQELYTRWTKNATEEEKIAAADRLKNMGSDAIRNEYEKPSSPQGKSPNGITPSQHIPGYGILQGTSHYNGGIKGVNRGQVWEAEAGEFLINKGSSMRYGKELAKIQNGTFNPYSYTNELVKNDMQRHYEALKVSENGNTPVQQVANSIGDVNGKIKVDIPSTITINIAGQGKLGEYDIRNLIMPEVDRIMKEAFMRSSKGGFNKEAFFNQADVLA